MSEKKESGIFFDIVLIIVAAPILFIQWLLLNGEFGAGKAIIFIVLMLVLGSLLFGNNSYDIGETTHYNY